MQAYKTSMPANRKTSCRMHAQLSVMKDSFVFRKFNRSKESSYGCIDDVGVKHLFR